MGVVLALAVVGITFLAYLKPKTYRELYATFMWLTIFAAASLSGAYLGGHSVFENMLPMIADDDMPEAAAFAGAGIDLGVALVACGAAATYLMFLRVLPLILEKDNDEDRPSC